MGVDTIKIAVREFLNRTIKNATLDDDDNYFTLGYVNSLFSLQLVNFIESEFKLTIEDEELDIDNFSSVNAICRFVDGKGMVASA